MRIGQTERLEDALNAAIFTPLTMQRIEAHLWSEPGENLGKVATGVDPRDGGAEPVESVCASGAGNQAHLALRRNSAHQDSDAAAGQGSLHERTSSCATPSRRISHSKSWPDLLFT